MGAAEPEERTNRIPCVCLPVAGSFERLSPLTLSYAGVRNRELAGTLILDIQSLALEYLFRYYFLWRDGSGDLALIFEYQGS